MGMMNYYGVQTCPCCRSAMKFDADQTWECVLCHFRVTTALFAFLQAIGERMKTTDVMIHYAEMAASSCYDRKMRPGEFYERFVRPEDKEVLKGLKSEHMQSVRLDRVGLVG